MKVYRCLPRDADCAILLRMAILAIAAIATAWSFPAAAQTITSSATVAAQLSSKPSRITQAIDEKQLLPLRGTVHPLAQTKFDQGKINDAQPVDRMLLLLQRGPEQAVALRQLLEDQLTLNSPKHHAWLTPQQFGFQFGPSDADIQATISWLRAKGFHSIKVGAGRSVIEFSGNAGQVHEAFHTEMHRYLVKGVERFANAGDPQIPPATMASASGALNLTVTGTTTLPLTTTPTGSGTVSLTIQ
jgi:hypothetical protein